MQANAQNNPYQFSYRERKVNEIFFNNILLENQISTYNEYGIEFWLNLNFIKFV